MIAHDISAELKEMGKGLQSFSKNVTQLRSQLEHSKKGVSSSYIILREMNTTLAEYKKEFEEFANKTYRK